MAQVTAAMDGQSHGATGLTISFTSEETWMATSVGWIAFERIVQALVLLGCVCVMGVGCWQFYRFRGRDALIESAIALEILSALSLFIFNIDGPFLEHTHYASMPWIADRFFMMLPPQLHSIATLLVALQLRAIIAKIEPGALSLDTRERQRLTCTSMLKQARSKIWHWRYGIFSAAILLALVLDVAATVLTGLFIFATDFTLIISVYLGLLWLFVGCLFMFQGVKIRRKLARATGSDNPRVVTFAIFVRRAGSSMIVLVVAIVCQGTFLEELKKDETGAGYWAALCVVWTIMNGAMLANNLFTIIGYRPPKRRKAGQHMLTVHVDEYEDDHVGSSRDLHAEAARRTLAQARFSRNSARGSDDRLSDESARATSPAGSGRFSECSVVLENEGSGGSPASAASRQPSSRPPSARRKGTMSPGGSRPSPLVRAGSGFRNFAANTRASVTQSADGFFDSEPPPSPTKKVGFATTAAAGRGVAAKQVEVEVLSPKSSPTKVSWRDENKPPPETVEEGSSRGAVVAPDASPSSAADNGPATGANGPALSDKL